MLCRAVSDPNRKFAMPRGLRLRVEDRRPDAWRILEKLTKSISARPSVTRKKNRSPDTVLFMLAAEMPSEARCS
jgi:hypothetical protein